MPAAGHKPAIHAVRANDIAEQAASWDAEAERTGRRGLFVPRAANAVADGNNIDFDFGSVEEAFPDVDPGMEPMGSLILVMIRQPKRHVSGGFIQLPAEDRKIEHDNTQVARVIAMGPLAFHSRDTGKPWPEGAWCQSGDFVKVPKYQGDPWAIAYTREDMVPDLENGGTKRETVTDYVRFALFKDLALLGRYRSATEALAAKAFY